MSPIDPITTRYLDLLKKTLTGTLYDEGQWTVVGPGGPLMRRLVTTALRKRSILLISSRRFDPGRRERGEDWPIIGFTMVGAKRLDNIQECVASVIADKVAGDFVECGVWRGGASIFARAVLDAYGATDRTVWLADSFEGMPQLTSETAKGDHDLSDHDYLAVSVDQVKDNFRKFDLLGGNVNFIKGWFSETLATTPIRQIAVLRLDGDHYSSTMDALNGLYSKVTPRGYVIVDDYNTFAGCKRAVTEFRAQHGIVSELVPIDRMAVFWRR
jgi:O-methyltransferase